MAGRRLNVNVGVLGHIDSGKTALARALSTTASTAAFDKQPQSRERGITLDLGFSCFSVPLPARLRPALPGADADAEPGAEPRLQVTLVDCPGHASLIRTIIGGAQIIDLMMLVIDVTKGMQTQSAECLVIGQIACQKLVVVLNKTDLLAEGKRQAAIEKMTRKMQKTLENTKFRGAPIIPVAARPGGPEAPETEAPQGISELIELLTSQIPIPARDPSGPFLMSVDHCFSIKGQGTVMTGTILSGSVSLGDSVEIPALKVVRKVKSMQMFRTPVTSAMQGDRLGVCVTQFDPKLLERGLVCAPESLHTVHAALVSVEKIPYFRGPLQTKAKFHITVGHETVMGRVMFFSPAPDDFDREPVLDSFDFSREYLFQEQYLCPGSAPAATDSGEADRKAGQAPEGCCPRQQWALVEFEKPVTCPRLCLVIGSRLDADIHANACRLAFHGVLLRGLEDRGYAESVLPTLRVYKLKHKQGVVERVMDDYSVIGRSLFKKETNIQLFVGLKVHLSTGEQGVIDSAFGQSGKFKVHIPDFIA
ncbi:selenocysteine-specific elongation factor isoform X2 [Camelus bactrianus]|uniref:Selenocysteine-specific elongation factor isoform X2 n=1 Tax=Camelus bactrianus TaxID=9837 RepID=A0AC58NR75_CAMBA